MQYIQHPGPMNFYRSWNPVLVQQTTALSDDSVSEVPSKRTYPHINQDAVSSNSQDNDPAYRRIVHDIYYADSMPWVRHYKPKPTVNPQPLSIGYDNWTGHKFLQTPFGTKKYLRVAPEVTDVTVQNNYASNTYWVYDNGAYYLYSEPYITYTHDLVESPYGTHIYTTEDPHLQLVDSEYTIRRDFGSQKDFVKWREKERKREHLRQSKPRPKYVLKRSTPDKVLPDRVAVENVDASAILPQRAIPDTPESMFFYDGSVTYPKRFAVLTPDVTMLKRPKSLATHHGLIVGPKRPTSSEKHYRAAYDMDNRNRHNLTSLWVSSVTTPPSPPPSMVSDKTNTIDVSDSRDVSVPKERYQRQFFKHPNLDSNRKNTNIGYRTELTSDRKPVVAYGDNNSNNQNKNKYNPHVNMYHPHPRGLQQGYLQFPKTSDDRTPRDNQRVTFAPPRERTPWLPIRRQAYVPTRNARTHR